MIQAGNDNRRITAIGTWVVEQVRSARLTSKSTFDLRVEALSNQRFDEALLLKQDQLFWNMGRFIGA